jgi:hypothetical protein
LVRGGDPGEIPWILQPSVGLLIETAGKRGHRIAEAEAVSDASRFAIADTAWAVRTRVRMHLIDHVLATRELELLRAEETIRSDYTDALQTKLDLGDASRQEVDLARVELQRLRVAVRARESEVEETRVALAGAIGVRPASLTSAGFARGTLDLPPQLETSALLELERRALLARTDILTALAMYQAAEAAVRLQVARQFPDLQIGPGFRWRESERRWVFDVGLPLPLLNRNEGPIAEAVARRERAAAQVVARQAGMQGRCVSFRPREKYWSRRTLATAPSESSSRSAMWIGQRCSARTLNWRLPGLTSSGLYGRPRWNWDLWNTRFSNRSNPVCAVSNHQKRESRDEPLASVVHGGALCRGHRRHRRSLSVAVKSDDRCAIRRWRR